jgi:NAD(P)-dependent dehydrogenase (short-subunit alcohol dehydrogenase family)
VLINNAGFLQSGAIEEVSIEAAHAQLETNYFGVVRMVRAALPFMRRQGSGLIAATSSLAGLVPLPLWGHYHASKFAVEGLMETITPRIET